MGARSELTDEGMRRESGSGKGVVVGCVHGGMMADCTLNQRGCYTMEVPVPHIFFLGYGMYLGWFMISIHFKAVTPIP